MLAVTGSTRAQGKASCLAPEATKPRATLPGLCYLSVLLIKAKQYPICHFVGKVSYGRVQMEPPKPPVL